MCVCVRGTVQTRGECVLLSSLVFCEKVSVYFSHSLKMSQSSEVGVCPVFFYLFLKVHKLFFFFLRLESRTELCSYNLTSVPFSFLLSFLLMSA